MKRTSSTEKLFLSDLMKTASHLKALSKGLSIGEMIAIIRKQLGMSQGVLARLAKVPQSTVSRIETSKKEPNLSTLQKILKALSCEMILIPLLTESVESIRHKQAQCVAEKKIRYLRGTMSLERQEPDKKLLNELLKDEIDQLLRSSGKKLWQE